MIQRIKNRHVNKILFNLSLTKYLYILLLGLFLLQCKKEKENQPPTCKITSPENEDVIEIGDTVTISVDATDSDGSIYDVKIYINNIEVGSIIDFPYKYKWNTLREEVGSFVLKAMASDNGGYSTTDRISIDLINNNMPIATFSVDTTEIKEGEAVTFSDESAYNPTTWEWDFGDGSFSTERNPMYKYNYIGIYNVSLIVSNEFGSDTIIYSHYITVKPSASDNVNGSVTDIDGNIYLTVTIGNQEWMAENLRVTKYANGTAIPMITDNSRWYNTHMIEAKRAYCWYNDDIKYKNSYGALYNWLAATNSSNSSASYENKIQGVCPDGWHLPTISEWEELKGYLINNGYNFDGSTSGNNIGKSLAAKVDWYTDDEIGTPGQYQQSNNSTGFTALPVGNRYVDGFDRKGYSAEFWSSSNHSTDLDQALSGRLDGYNKGLGIYGRIKEYGLNVRCIKD